MFVASIVALPANGRDYPGEIHRHRVDEPRPFGLTKPILYGETVTFMNLADSTILVNWNNILRPVAISHQLARSTASQFTIVDRGIGRIAIQSAIGGGFVTISESGRMSEVRIEKNDKGDASTFQWT